MKTLTIACSALLFGLGAPALVFAQSPKLTSFLGQAIKEQRRARHGKRGEK
jgi:hypothetical protein